MDASSPQNIVEQRADESVKRLAPELRAAVEGEFAQLAREHRPVGRTEEVLVREMARHVTALAHAEKAEPSVLAMSAAMVANTSEITGGSGLDAALAASVISDGTERVSRYRQGHERALHLALRSLVKMQDLRKSHSRNCDFEWERFSVEEDCEAYLIDWHQPVIAKPSDLGAERVAPTRKRPQAGATDGRQVGEPLVEEIRFHSRTALDADRSQ